MKFFLTISVSVILLFLSFSSLFAQDESAEQTTDRRICVFLNVDLSSEIEEARYETIITDAIEADLRKAGFFIIPRDTWQEIKLQLGLSDIELVSGEVGLNVAREVYADIAITGFYRIEEGSLLLEIKCYDVHSGRLIAGVLKGIRFGLSVYGLIDSAISEIVPSLKTPLEPLPPLIVQVEDSLSEITLCSEDVDADVYAVEDEFLGRMKNGCLSIQSVPDTILSIETRKEGFHPRNEEVKLDSQKRIYNLAKLMKETSWASEILYSYGRLLGIGIGLRYYFIQDQFFASLEDYFFVSNDPEIDSDPIFHNDFRILAGNYLFFNPSSLFRLGLSGGIGVVFSDFSIPGPLFTDLYINPANLWFELNLQDWIFYYRVELKYGLDLGNNLWGNQWHTIADYIPPMTLGVVKKW